MAAVVGKTSVASRAVTVEDVLSIKVISDAQVSPDGTRIAFVISDSFTDDRPLPRAQIWVVSARGGEPRPFTAGTGTDLSPRWSPDGKSVLFLSDRQDPGNLRLYLWGEGQGEARPLNVLAAPPRGSVQHRLEVSGPIGSPIWSADGTRIAFLTEEQPQDSDSGQRTRRADAIEVGKDYRFARLWEVEVETGKAEQLTHGRLHVWDFDRAADGRFVLIVADNPEESSWYRARLAVLQPGAAEPKIIYSPAEVQRVPSTSEAEPPLRQQLARPLWSPDGQTICFISCAWSDRGLVGGDVYAINPDGRNLKNLTEGEPISVSWTWWRDGHSMLLVAGWHEGEQALANLSVESRQLSVFWKEQAAFGDRYQPRFSASRTGTIAVARENPHQPREIWTLSAPSAVGTWRQLTTLQPSTEALELANVDTIHWKSRDGASIQGHLMLPGDGQRRPYPLILFPHGGPVFLHQYLFHGSVEGPYAISFELFTAAGFAVLLPNPRGSLGWGSPFAEALLGDMGGIDLEDILSGVDYCVREGIADPSRLGIGGWSSAGYLTPWAICQTDRFKAAFMGAGVADWRTMRAGRSVQWTFAAQFIPGDPYEIGGGYDQRSPLTHIKRVKTPTLIIHCENDPLLPVDQAYAFYRGMRDHGQVAELVVYPREGHAIREKAHIVDASHRIVAWFGRWLKP